MSAETYDFLVIGGGVIGTAIARYPDRLDILCSLDTACAFIVHCRMVDVDVDVQIYIDIVVAESWAAVASA